MNGRTKIEPDPAPGVESSLSFQSPPLRRVSRAFARAQIPRPSAWLPLVFACLAVLGVLREVQRTIEAEPALVSTAAPLDGSSPRSTESPPRSGADDEAPTPDEPGPPQDLPGPGASPSGNGADSVALIARPLVGAGSDSLKIGVEASGQLLRCILVDAPHRAWRPPRGGVPRTRGRCFLYPVRPRAPPSA